MKFNINNFINTSSQSPKIVDFQDLDHIDGVSISAVSAGPVSYTHLRAHETP